MKKVLILLISILNVVAAYSQTKVRPTLRNQSKKENSLTTAKEETTKKPVVYHPDGRGLWQIGLTAKAGGDVVAINPGDGNGPQPEWKPFGSLGLAVGYFDERDRFSITGSYSFATNVVGNEGVGSIAAINLQVLSFYCQSGIRTDVAQGYDIAFGFRTSLRSMYLATMELEKPTEEKRRKWSDCTYFYVGGTLRTLGVQNFPGFQFGLQANLFPRSIAVTRQ